MRILDQILRWAKARIDRADARNRARLHARRSIYCAQCLEPLHIDELVRGFCARCAPESDSQPRPLGHGTVR